MARERGAASSARSGASRIRWLAALFAAPPGHIEQLFALPASYIEMFWFDTERLASAGVDADISHKLGP